MTDVLWAVPVSDMGGVARHTADVFAHGVPGYDLHLLVPPGPFAEVARDAGHRVLVARFGPDHGLAASRRALRDAATQTGAAIVHSHLAYADFVVALTSLGSVTRVSTEHGIALDDRVYHSSRVKSSIMGLAHRLRMLRLDALIAVSHATAHAIRTKWHPPRRLPIEVVVNGIDRSEASGTPATTGLHVAALARLAPEKGLITLLHAFATVHAAHPAARLTIAGDGPLRDEIAQTVDALGLGDVVELPGFVEGIEAVGDVHVVVQLSVWENCSYALLDALVAGCGVVATDVGGNGEILPARCLVPHLDAAAAAECITTQGLDVAERPVLRESWPTVAEMCDSIAQVYGQVGA